MSKSQIIGAILAVLILIVMNFIPATDLLSRSAINNIGILIAVIVLLVTEPLPIGITCLSSIFLLVIFNVTPDVKSALSGYTNQIVFFVLASFGISEAITKVPLTNRFLKILIKLFGKNVRLILLAFMIASAVLSSFVSNVAATAVFIAVVLTFMQIYKNDNDRKRTGKAFMIALPVASMIGGMLTPAGSSLNLLTMNYIRQLTGISVSFVEWMLMGIPVVVIMLPIAWLIIVKVYGVTELGEKDIQEFVNNLDVPEKMDFKEKYVIAIVFAMFVFWILSSWYPVFNITVVALVGFFLFFLPKIQILTWDEFEKSVSWPAFFLLASIITVGDALIANGVEKWLITFLPSSINLPLFGIAFVVGIIVFLMLIIVPVAPALIALLSAPLVGLSANIGITPLLPMMTLGLTVANCYLLPLDTVPIITYMTGYYKMYDMPKSTAFIQVIMAAVVAAWLPVALKIIGHI
ncbi:MAG: SLC13 family permease [Bacillota bacterium]|nr:SLC13 family permease [Bacillota bacterium]HHU29094.1 sodium:sulfate symporter [Bacillota bacterium]